MTGAGVVVVALGVGVGDEEGPDTGLDDALGVGVTEDSTLGARFGVVVGDGLDDADGPDSDPGANVGPDTGLAELSSAM